jgi:hypothetical protein
MHNIKKIYLYVVSVITLVIMVWGGITLVNMALKAWVFTKADRYIAYPYPKSNCEQIVEQKDGSASVARMPECEPGFEEEQRKADEQNRAAQNQRDAAQSIAMILVASPVFYFHWRLARKES